MLDALDQLAIRRLVDLYGYLVDSRKFSRIHEVFTEDVVYDVSDFGHGVQHGIAEVVVGWRTAQHPLSHHVINVLIDEVEDGAASVIATGIGVGERGRVGSVTYYDTAIRTAIGWRLSHRRAVLRRADSIPGES